MKYKASNYQKYATDFIVKHDQAGLFLEMGLGKTVITLTAIRDLILLGDIKRVLVIAPLNVARTVWADEAAKWDHTRHLRCVKVLGDRAARIDALNQDADIYIINRENVMWLVDYIRTERGARWPFDTLVIDELSSFKDKSSGRWKAIRKALPAIHRVIGLTGTPSPNGLIDLWAQVYLLDQGQRLGRTLTAYRHQYFTPGATRGHVVFDWRLLPGSEEAIHEKLQDLCVSMRTSDWLDMPDRIMNTVPVELDSKALRQYKTMEKDMILQLPEGDLSAVNAAVLCGKLLQLASGCVYGDDGDAIQIHTAKIDALREIVNTATSPVLVFYGYRHEAALIQKAIPQAKKLWGAEMIEAWNRGEIPVMLAHPDSAGHGLNLQAGGHTVVWYSLTWSLEKYQQANARLWRRGQEHTVIVHHLVAKGTVDERVLQVLAGKDSTQEALMEAVKAAREDVCERRNT